MSYMNSDKVITSLENNVFRITLNFPEKLNCMGFEMLHALVDSFQEAQSNKKVKIITIEGAGDKAFSSGANLKEFNDLKGVEISDWIRLGHKVFHDIENSNKPTIALIKGYTMGGGLELALTCDFRLAEDGAIFSSPELKHGWLPGWGGITRLTALIGKAKAKEMIFLSQNVDSMQAKRIGLISDIAMKGELSDLLGKYIYQLNQIDLSMFSMVKNVMKGHNGIIDKNMVDFDVLAAHYAKSNSHKSNP